MENSPAALESKIALAKAADKHALANNHNMLQETMANWSKTLLEHKTLGAAAIMIGGLAIHDGKTTAAAVKTLGGEILPTAEKILAGDAVKIGEKAMVEGTASSEAPALFLSDVVRQRYPGGQIIDIGDSTIDIGLKKLAEQNESAAFGAVTRGDDLLAVKLPDGGFIYADYPKSRTFVNQGNYWQVQPKPGYNTYDINAPVTLVKTPAGPELHVLDDGTALRSVHYYDGRVALENTQNGALIEGDPLYRNIVRFRDVNGETFATNYINGGEARALRYGADGRLKTGEDAIYTIGHGHVAVKTESGQVFHALDGNQYATSDEAMQKSASMFNVSKPFARGFFELHSNFPTEYVSLGYVKSRGGALKQASLPLETSAAEDALRLNMAKWLENLK